MTNLAPGNGGEASLWGLRGCQRAIDLAKRGTSDAQHSSCIQGPPRSDSDLAMWDESMLNE